MDDPGDSRGDVARRPTDCLVLATTDPAIAAEADHQSNWKRHPFATIRLETTAAVGADLMPLASPWTIEPPPPTTPEPRDDGPIAPEAGEKPADLPAPRPVIRAIRPASGPSWAVVAVGLLGGLIGSVGYQALIGSRRRRSAPGREVS